MYKIFVASPGGLGDERQAFRDAITEYNETDAIHRCVLFRAVGWEATLPGMGRPQELINSDIRDCDFLILLLWDRWGSDAGTDSSGKNHSSGTEEEYSLARQCLVSTANPMREISVFFKLVDTRQMTDPGLQLRKVIDFKNQLENEKVLLYQTFDSLSAFKLQLTRLLAKWLRDHEARVNTDSDNGRAGEMTGFDQNLQLENSPSNSGSQPSEEEPSGLIGEAYEALHSGYFSTAENIFSKVIEESQDTLDLIEAKSNLAWIRDRQGLFREAVRLYSDAIELSEQNSVKIEDRARNYVGKGSVELSIGEVTKARESFETAKRLAEETSSPILKAYALGNVSSTFSFTHELLRAIETLKVAVNLRLSEGEEQLSIVDTLDLEIAILCVAMGNFRAAQTICQTLSENDERLSNVDSSPNWPRLNAWIAWKRGDREEADQLFNQAYQMALLRAEPLGAIPFLEDLSIFSLQLGRYRQSEFYADRITDLVKEQFGSRHPLLGVYSLSLGLLYANRKGFAQADNIADAALKGFSRMGVQNCPREAVALYVKSIAIFQMGKRDLAVDYLLQAQSRLREFDSKAHPLAKEVVRCLKMMQLNDSVRPGNFGWRRMPLGPQSF